MTVSCEERERERKEVISIGKKDLLVYHLLISF